MDTQVSTGNEIANQVLGVKAAHMHQLGIPGEFEANLPSRIALPDYLFAAVLANLMDNAIEASQKVKDPLVTVKLGTVKSYLSLVVKNRIEPRQASLALGGRTTKAEPALHGMGREIVVYIAREHQGMISYEVVGEEFVASVRLEMGEEPVQTETPGRQRTEAV